VALGVGAGVALGVALGVGAGVALGVGATTLTAALTAIGTETTGSAGLTIFGAATMIVIFGVAITAFCGDFLGIRNIDTNKLRPSLCSGMA
jgi:hypothetical protein